MGIGHLIIKRTDSIRQYVIFLISLAIMNANLFFSGCHVFLKYLFSC